MAIWRKWVQFDPTLTPLCCPSRGFLDAALSGLNKEVAAQTEEDTMSPILLSKTGKELVCVDGVDSVLDLEPLAVCAHAGGRDDSLTKFVTFDWVLELVSSFRHLVGISCVGHEEELMNVFAALEKERGNCCTKTPSKLGGKFVKELKGLKSSVNYDGKMYVSRKCRKDGRESSKLK